MMQPKSRVKIASEETLSNGWTRLSSYLLDYIDRKGATQRLKREIYHRTPAACILLYDPKRDLVVLVRQFRLAVHLNGDPAWMIEVPAGLLDDDHPEAAIRREAMEETGFSCAMRASCSSPIPRRVPSPKSSTSSQPSSTLPTAWRKAAVWTRNTRISRSSKSRSTRLRR
ncbi:hypothetical protein M2311_002725 [Rhizobium leguminosarum]|nr:hypothetical protein [Rhizobium leguminosarum]